MNADVINNHGFKCIIVVKLKIKNQHLFKEVALVISSRLITPHVLQLFLLSYQMYVNITLWYILEMNLLIFSMIEC